MNYSDIDQRKTAFIFELDNVLYPEKDYLYQVYYLFAAMLEYTELIDAKSATKLLIDTYIQQGKEFAFGGLRGNFEIAEKYRPGFDKLMTTAKLPLKLLLYKNMLSLMQQIIIDRKKIFIVTNGNPRQQLNKIKQTEWHGLDPYLTCYFADELEAKPGTGALEYLMKENNLRRRALLMIGNSDIDVLCAQDCGIDYFNSNEL